MSGIYDHDPGRVVSEVTYHDVRLEVVLDTVGGPVRLGGRYRMPSTRWNDPAVELRGIIGGLERVVASMEDPVRAALGMVSRQEDEEAKHLREVQARAMAEPGGAS